MSNNSTSISPETQATDQVSFKILSNKSPLNAEYSIISMEVHACFNKISSARISMADGDLSKQDFPISSKDDSLIPGNEFEIQLGTWVVMHESLKTSPRCRVAFDALVKGLLNYIKSCRETRA